jgi:hypothetical protein
VLVEKPRANVYTVMLAISLIALMIGCYCLAQEMAQYDWDFKAAGAKVTPEPPDLPPAAAPPTTPPPTQEQPPATPPAGEVPPGTAPPTGTPPTDGTPPAEGTPPAAGTAPPGTPPTGEPTAAPM